jgi:Thioredoxin-like/Gram-negative bacterial TonB protein C-terminal
MGLRIGLRGIAAALLIVAVGTAIAQAPSSDDERDAASAKAHALLDRAVRINGPSVQGALPWHLKADFQMQMGSGPVQTGTVEEWWKGPDQWRRTYTLKNQTYTEWSVDRTHHFEIAGAFPRFFVDLRIATPLITPLFQAVNFLPEYPMEVHPMEAGVQVDCVSVTNPVHYVDKIDPDFLFPKYCLDHSGILRGVVTSNTLVTFNDYVLFQNRGVAKTVDVLVDGHKVSESKITVMEALAPADEAQLQPDPKATPQPFEPMASDPQVVMTHAEAPMIPANAVVAGGSGPVFVPVIIQKDGRARATGQVRGSPILITPTLDAVTRIRFQPYLIDGQPVEVAQTIVFTYGKNGYLPTVSGGSEKPTGFDPKRDPAEDLKVAEAEAQQTHKHILLDVGGDWCIWCAYMDRFFTEHPDVAASLNSNYVLVKVNWSATNHNNTFLMQYAVIHDFPFLVVLDENGKLLKAERTNELEKGNGYDPDKMRAFLDQWKPGHAQLAAQK